jgi:hypothetical protein
MIRFGALGYARDKRVARDGNHPDGRVTYSASGPCRSVITGSKRGVTRRR